MKILLALDKFKGTLSSLEVAEALAKGIQTTAPEVGCELWPVSDGGQGFLAALKGPLQLELHPCQVQTPQGTSTPAYIGWQASQRRVLIESCQATGLHLIPSELRHPLQLNSFGLGQLLLAAAQFNPREILIGLGSSGTVDGGLGLAQALGYGLFNAAEAVVLAYPQHLLDLQSIVPPRAALFSPACRITALCDVNNPLLGPEGGIQVYSPQKGATPAEINQLEAGLHHWTELLCRDLALPGTASDWVNLPSTGAAGGLGLGLKALLGAELRSGAEWLLSASGLEQALQEADLLITGEGQFDQQSGFGKWPARVIQAAHKQNLPIVLVTGQRIQGELPLGIRQAFALVEFEAKAAESGILSQAALVQVGELIGKKVQGSDKQVGFKATSA